MNHSVRENKKEKQNKQKSKGEKKNAFQSVPVRRLDLPVKSLKRLTSV